MTTEVRIVDSSEALYRATADRIFACAQEAVGTRGRYVLALSGGITPAGVFSLLAHDEKYRALPWAKTHVFWGDERHVPPDHPDSNYRMAKETLLDHVAVPQTQVHRIEAELADADEAARRYETTLRQFFGDQPVHFDLALMGLGGDGHTASLFPHSSALNERERLAVANRTAAGTRITLTVPVFNDARWIVFVVSGAAKAVALHAALEAPRDPRTWPAQFIEPAHGRLIWLVDEAAASLLDPR